MWSFLAFWWWVYFGLLFRSLGNYFSWPGGYRRAVVYFSRALRRSPGEARLYFWRGTLYWRELGDHTRAEADLSRSIELDPRRPRTFLNRAFVRWYDTPPRYDLAAEDLRTYLSLSQDPYWCAVAREHLERLEREPVAEGPQDSR